MRRRLAFVIQDLNTWGGQDRSTLEIARRLSHRFPVDICSFTLDDPGGLSGWGDVRVHRVRPNVRHPAVARHTFFYGATLGPLELLPRLKGEKPPLVHATGACSLVSDVVQVQFVNSAWKRVQATLDPDLCRAPRARSRTGLGGKALEFYHERLLDYNIAVERAVYRRGKTYIAIADCVAAELRDHFRLNERIHVVYHGVDSRQFRPSAGDEEFQARAALRAKFGFSSEHIVFAFVGAYERKGLALAIDALAKLPAEVAGRARVLAVGSGDVDGFRARAERQGVSDRVVFAPHTKDIVPYYQACDAFLLPTLYEPFGLVILEAMACGLAPIVSELAGASELLREGESGIRLANPADAGEAARAMARLIADEPLRLTLGQGARRIAEARSWDQVAQEYAGIIGPLLAGEPRA